MEVLVYIWRLCSILGGYFYFVLVGVFGDLHYDALGLAFLHLEELNVGEPCICVAIFGGFGGV